MAFPVTVTYTFGTQTGAVPLSYLDTNFSNLTTFINGISSGSNAFVTPVLGTPTSGSLVNCTGYTAANLSGTLAIAKGGTGQTTANAALNALLPSQATNSGKVLTTDGTNTSWVTNGSGTVTSVAQTFTGGLISVAGSPITSSGTLALTVAGTSGGIPYFSGASTWASSSVLAANSLMIGGGAGVAPSTVTTGTGVVTALGVNTGTAGAFVVNGGVLGTPSSGTVTNLTGTASININGTVGATTASTGAFTTLSASSTVSGTGFSTYLASPPAIGSTTASTGAFTTLSASSTISGTGFTNYFASPPAIGGTASNTGKFTSLEMTSVTDTSSLARNAGRTANTTVTNTITYTTAGLTLLSQTAAVGSSWRIRAFGQFTAASSATARNAQIACFWGATQLTAITPAVLISTAQTTQWQVEFVLTASSTTAIWTTGTLIGRTASATALAMDNATPASTTVTSGAQTLDLRVSMSASVAGDSWIVQQVVFERLE